MLRRLMLASVVLALALSAAGCGGGGEEPSEIPKSPPRGKSLPR